MERRVHTGCVQPLNWELDFGPTSSAASGAKLNRSIDDFTSTGFIIVRLQMRPRGDMPRARNVEPCNYLLPLKSRETAGKVWESCPLPCGLRILLVGSKELPQFALELLSSRVQTYEEAALWLRLPWF